MPEKLIYDFTRCGCPAGVVARPADQPLVFKGVTPLVYTAAAVAEKTVETVQDGKTITAVAPARSLEEMGAQIIQENTKELTVDIVRAGDRLTVLNPQVVMPRKVTATKTISERDVIKDVL